ncbi:MAG: competence/damage-inducible protein A [Cytophagaceae bacterium]|nr:competence/damage-inducible protein A [Cytophagaceae bacterium]MDW8457316.1 competence/damage-inducible protein A [Cytophagaceae bacterium]
MNYVYAEVITIGDEILYGQITDTNSAWISSELDKIGIRTLRKSSVGDNEEQILEILNAAEKRVQLIVLTGGLGPTKDDVTKTSLAKFYNTTIELHEVALAQLENHFNKKSKPLNALNRTQAYLPKCCTYIPNRYGTAPAMWFERNGVILVSMPGVPYEMKNIMEEEIIPRLKKQFKLPHIEHRYIRTIGVGESVIAEKIKLWEEQLPPEFKLAYLPSIGQVKLRITGTSDNLEKLNKDFSVLIDRLTPLIHEYIYSYTDENLEKTLGDILRRKKITLATAESCTGGYIAHLITSVPNSSEYYKGTIVAYQNEIKEDVLGVSAAILKAHTAVSEPTALAMAKNARIKFRSDVAIATTGILGPGGATLEHPIGTVFIAFSSSEKEICKKVTLSERRDYNIIAASYAALNLLRENI